MKKLYLFVLLSLLSTSMFSKDLACTEDQYSFMKESRYWLLAETAGGQIHVADLKTMKYDKKNKIVETWVFMQLSTVAGEKGVGYIRTKGFYDLKRAKVKFTKTQYLDCNGNFIGETPGANTWNEAEPGSAHEGALYSLKKIQY